MHTLSEHARTFPAKIADQQGELGLPAGGLPAHQSIELNLAGLRRLCRPADIP
ncbi:hypothetical protein ACFYO0_30330 [Streptomyces sp. NPDC006365]|uniref:hypothetical protein n=1 Tax=Streptomyces sp. NPDC006365 TaxID=3364744 RepID=UPI0036C1BA5A